MHPDNSLKYRILDIIKGTTVDGPGFRTSIYIAGCNHKCEGCHNPQSWDPEQGREMSLSEIMKIVKEEDFDVTLSGGDPLYYPCNIKPLIDSIKEEGYNVWIYTGYTWEEVFGDKDLLEAVESADVLVDGPFILELRNPDLPFRGSSNQRLIDIQASLENGMAVLIHK